MGTAIGAAVGGVLDTASWSATASAAVNAAVQGVSIATGNQSSFDWGAVGKSAIVGAVAGTFSATGGFGLMSLGSAMGGGTWSTAAGVASQAIGSFGTSVGNNWANGRDLFSTFSVGIGPVNIPLSSRGISFDALDWVGANIGNIAFNSVGLANTLTGGNVSLSFGGLSPVYSGGLLDKAFSGRFIAMGAYDVMGNSNYVANSMNQVVGHELHHVWQSRMMGSLLFMPAYLLSAINPQGYDGIYFEKLAYSNSWGLY